MRRAFFRSGDRRRGSAVNGSDSSAAKVHCAAALAFSWQKSNIIFSNDLPGIIFQPPPSVLTGCRVIIFLKETDIAPDVGEADLLADRLDRIGSVGQQREGTFRAVAV